MIENMSRNALKLLVSFIFTGFVISNNDLYAGDGGTVFKQNCAVCHSLGDNKITGPGLKGVMDRVPPSPTKEQWLHNWIKNNNKVISSGDAYAAKLVSANGGADGMSEFEFLSDDDITSLITFIKNPPAPKVEAPTATTPGGETAPAEKGINPLYLLLAVIVILAILISILRGVRISLRNVTNKKEGKEEEPALTFWEEVKEWTGAHRRFAVVCVIVISCIGMKSCWNSLFRVGVYYDWQTGRGYKPEQPIKFSHKIHAGDNAIACQYCHNSVEKGRHSGIPTVNICMNCHKGISKGPTTGETEIAKIYAAAGFDVKSGKIDESKANPIKWVKVHNLPDHVYFNHSQHVVVGKLDCAQCHGNVKEMGVVEQQSPLTMKWCIECHRKTEVAMDGNPYYEKLHAALKEKYKDQHLKKFTVAQMGGIECAKCHY